MNIDISSETLEQAEGVYLNSRQAMQIIKQHFGGHRETSIQGFMSFCEEVGAVDGDDGQGFSAVELYEWLGY